MALIEDGSLEKVGIGLARPEDVAVDAAGNVFASDQSSAVALVTPTGDLVRIGSAKGRPNGISIDLQGRLLIANMALACVQELDAATQDVRVLIDHVGEQPLLNANYPLVDSRGRIWISCCSRQTDLPSVLRACVPDGFIARRDPDGNVEMAAEHVTFPNCMALDANETHLYVARTAAGDVRRFEIHSDGGLGPEEPYGPSPIVPEANGGRLHGSDATGDPADQRGWTDGIAFDAAGNLWVTIINQNKVIAITPDGDAVEVLADPAGDLLNRPTSVTWGGPDMRDLYIGSTTADYLVKARTSVEGLPTTAQKHGIRVTM